MEKMKTVNEYLLEHSVLDGNGNMDGFMAPTCIIHGAIKMCIEGKLKYEPSENIVDEKYFSYKQYNDMWDELHYKLLEWSDRHATPSR